MWLFRKEEARQGWEAQKKQGGIYHIYHTYIAIYIFFFGQKKTFHNIDTGRVCSF